MPTNNKKTAGKDVWTKQEGTFPTDAQKHLDKGIHVHTHTKKILQKILIPTSGLWTQSLLPDP